MASLISRDKLYLAITCDHRQRQNKDTGAKFFLGILSDLVSVMVAMDWPSLIG